MSALAFVSAAFLNSRLMGEIRSVLMPVESDTEAVLPSARYHLALVIPEAADTFHYDLSQGLRMAAAEAGGVVQVFRTGATEQDSLEGYFDMGINSGLDGIIIFLGHQNSPEDFQLKARGSSTVVVSLGTDRPRKTVGSYIGSSSLQQGFEAGKLVGAALGPRARTGVIISGGEGTQGSTEPFYQGVVSALAVYGSPAVKAAVKPRGGIFSGEEMAQNLLESDPELNALICSTAYETEGAAQVVVDFNLVGKVMIVGADETDAIRRYLAKGVIAASVVRDARKMGQEAFLEFRRQKEGGTPSGPREVGFRILQGEAP